MHDVICVNLFPPQVNGIPPQKTGVKHPSSTTVCLLQKVCNFGSFEKCYLEHFVFILFFLRLIVRCFDVPFSIGQRRSYIIPCISVDDFKMALSSKDLSEHERILHHTLPILINIIGVLDILCQFRQFSFAEHMACR